MASNYNTKWVNSADNLPPIGETCPVCNEGFIEDNSFTSKKGIRFQSVSCKSCKVDWVVSQWKPNKTDFKSTPTIKKENEDFGVEDEAEKIIKRLDNIDSGIATLKMGIEEIRKGLEKE